MANQMEPNPAIIEYDGPQDDDHMAPTCPDQQTQDISPSTPKAASPEPIHDTMAASESEAKSAGPYVTSRGRIINPPKRLDL
jgi:hypothetical protein